MTLTVKQLGRKGRFANQLFQYAHLRQRAGSDYECPAWIGQKLFGLNDPPVTPGAKDIGFRFPGDSSCYDKTLFRSLFQPTAAVLDRIAPVLDMVQNAGSRLIGLHLRRGDYGTFKHRSARWCFVAPSRWYIDWLEARDLTGSVLVVASDDENAAADFRRFNLITMEKTIPGAPYYPDFYALTRCEVLLISNSTFGFAASMLSDAAECWRPRLSKQALVPYDPWNAPLVFKDERY